MEFLLHSALDAFGLNPYQAVVDFLLLGFAIYVLIQKPEKPEKPLSREEIDQLIDEWKPEPLVPLLESDPLLEMDAKLPVITSTTQTHVSINNKAVLHLARTNFFGMIGNPEVEEAARKTLYKYGVGTCGPRQFYGTIDVHLSLEERIAKFLGMESCIIYSYGLATACSVIPAFAGREDLCILDKGCSISPQIGANLSRGETFWFEHNNMEDLERILKGVQRKDQITKRPITRRFIIFEGVYYNYGDICPLPKIVELANKYKYRLIMDDSCGLGVLGKTGRGTCEYYGVDPNAIHMLCGALSKSTSSVGGFCCGSKAIIYHQRLNSAGYVYSASLPPMLAAASQTALDIIDGHPELPANLAKNSELAYKGLASISGMEVTSIPQIPVLHFRLAKPYAERLTTEKVLQNIVDEALANGVLLTRAKYSRDEKFMPPPSIRICVSCIHTPEQLNNAVDVIKKACAKVLSQAP